VNVDLPSYLQHGCPGSAFEDHKSRVSKVG
jgi:hypothetical protein